MIVMDPISAYDFQHKDGRTLSRQRVIELAESGPAYWKVTTEEMRRAALIDGYFPEGFSEMRACLINMWKNVWAYFTAKGKKVAPDTMGFYTRELYSKICDYSDGYINLALDKNSDIKEVFENFLIEMPPRNMRNDENVWLFLQVAEDEIYDLVFKHIFEKRLFFDQDNLPGEMPVQDELAEVEAAPSHAEDAPAPVASPPDVLLPVVVEYAPIKTGVDIENLPPIESKRQITKGEIDKDTIIKTREDNPEVMERVNLLKAQGLPHADIRKHLEKNKVRHSIIDCFLSSNHATLNAAKTARYPTPRKKTSPF